MLRIKVYFCSYKTSRETAVHIGSISDAQSDTAIAEHVALMLSFKKGTEAAALAVNQPNVPHGKECALRQRISRSVGVHTTGQLKGHGLHNWKPCGHGASPWV